MISYRADLLDKIKKKVEWTKNPPLAMKPFKWYVADMQVRRNEPMEESRMADQDYYYSKEFDCLAFVYRGNGERINQRILDTILGLLKQGRLSTDMLRLEMNDGMPDFDSYDDYDDLYDHYDSNDEPL